MTPLTKYEQETIINFNAGSSDAIVYTRDKNIIKRFDALVTAYPDVYRCIHETDIDKTYINSYNSATALSSGTFQYAVNRFPLSFFMNPKDS